MPAHVVVLVPGFMGFGRLGSLYYFGDRVLATLRGALQARLGGAVTVVGVRTDPVGSLASRQALLLAELARLDGLVGGAPRFHLVGHSTGGVDAELLTCAAPLAGGGWGAFSALRRRIASVTTIAAPHYGTCLADSAVAGWFVRPTSLGGGVEVARLVGALAWLLLTRSTTLEGLEAVLLDAPGSAAFVKRLLTHRQLLLDLRPDRMMELRRTNPPDAELAPSLRCFVTVTPPVGVPGVPHACDGFFACLHGITAQRGLARDAGETARFVEALEAHASRRLIGNPAAVLDPFDAAASDGIVNSARQLLETHAPGRDPAAALAAVVVGDHGDVLGYYDRQDALEEGPPLDSGFFRSGAGFGDDQFFALWSQVAEQVAAAADPSSAARLAAGGAP